MLGGWRLEKQNIFAINLRVESISEYVWDT